MKKLAFVLVINLLSYQGLQANDRENPHQQSDSNMTWQTQMRSYISYPEVLRQSNWEGVIQFNFQVDADGRVREVQVQTDNRKAKIHLTNQLLGKKLSNSQLAPSRRIPSACNSASKIKEGGDSRKKSRALALPGKTRAFLRLLIRSGLSIDNFLAFYENHSFLSINSCLVSSQK
jgi:hypothetical protein